MIGQFTYTRGGETVTAALADDLSWQCLDPFTLRILRTWHAATPADGSPARGGVRGAGLLAEAAERFKAVPYFFSGPLPEVIGRPN